MTIGLREFLREQLARDEHSVCAMGNSIAGIDSRWSPDKLLGDIAAKRLIMELADEASGLDMQVDGEFRVGTRDMTAEPFIGDLILQQLALRYSHLKGYREEWRPDECQTEMVARHERWHGTSLYCCKCGESWADEGRYPRPFRPGWRAKAVAYHRELWDRASHGPPPTMGELYPSEEEIIRRMASVGGQPGKDN